MAFESFAEGTSREAPRAARLAVSYTTAILVIGGLGLAVTLGTRARPASTTDDVMDVVLTKLPEKAPPPPPVAAPPAAALLVPKTVKINPQAAPPAPVAVPTSVSRDKLKEANPADDKGAAGVHEGGDVAGTQGGTGTAAAPPPAPPPPVVSQPVAAPPPPPKTVAIDENTEPPVAISQPRPAVPDELRREGVDAVYVVVRFVVTETGDVADAVIVKGHPLLDASVLAAVRQWKFKPATSQGRPVPFPKTVKIPFKLKT